MKPRRRLTGPLWITTAASLALPLWLSACGGGGSTEGLSIEGGSSNTSVASAETTGRLNDTGMLLCGDYAYHGGIEVHDNTVSCALQTDTERDPVPAGQDGVQGRDVENSDDSDGHAGFSFTKISTVGQVLPATASQWGCIRDNVTGLVWEVKTNDAGLHDRGWTYSWFETAASRNGGHAGAEHGGVCQGTAHCDTSGYRAAVNAAGWCGASDWRLPTREELRSITRLDRASPAVDTVWFPHTLSDWYWTASPLANDKQSAWLIAFDQGYDGFGYKASAHPVRLVRGSP